MEISSTENFCFQSGFCLFSHKSSVLCCLVEGAANQNLRGGSPEGLVTNGFHNWNVSTFIAITIGLASHMLFYLCPSPDCRPWSSVGYHDHSASRK